MHGDLAAARAWIEAAPLSARDRQALERFVARFPAALFERADPATTRELEARDGVSLPPWYHTARAATPQPPADAGLEFDDFDRIAPRSDSLHVFRYRLIEGYRDEEQRALLGERSGYYPIGRTRDGERSILLLNLRDPLDLQIHELAEDDAHDAEWEGCPAREAAYLVFASWATMLGHIVTLD